MFDLITALELVIARGGSDLQLKAGGSPLVRIHGELDWLDPTLKALEARDTEQVVHDLLPEARLKEFEQRHEIDCSHFAPGLGTFRVNAYMQRGTVAVVVRVIPNEIRTISELGLPDVVGQLGGRVAHVDGRRPDDAALALHGCAVVGVTIST